ncbi:MAG: DNA repair protein RecO [Anaerolineae bacterium]|nr:DNA repair protein RecO [Anaerolineae bacterium]
MPLPDHTYRTEAVVLRRQDLGEADRILTLYTRGYGKLKAVAKGVRKPASRKAGHLELFMQADLLLAQGRTLDVITQAQTIEPFLSLRDDLEHATYAAHFVELLDAFTEEADENDALYYLLTNGLSWLCRTSDLQRTARYYELRLLDVVGYRPQFFECVICGGKIQPHDQFYSPQGGGVICPVCGPNHSRTRPLALGLLKVLRYLQTHPFETVEQLNLSSAVCLEAERLLHNTLTYHLERRLRSAAFLQRLRYEARSG